MFVIFGDLALNDSLTLPDNEFTTLLADIPGFVDPFAVNFKHPEASHDIAPAPPVHPTTFSINLPFDTILLPKTGFKSDPVILTVPDANSGIGSPVLFVVVTFICDSTLS